MPGASRSSPRRRSRLLVPGVAVGALAAGLLAGTLLSGGNPTSLQGESAAQATPSGPAGSLPPSVASEMPVPSSDPTSQTQLDALQQAVIEESHPIPGGRVDIKQIETPDDGRPTRMVLDITPDFNHSYEGGYRLEVTALGMGGTSARFSTCLDVASGRTQDVELFSRDDTARERWTDMRFDLVRTDGCPPDAG